MDARADLFSLGVLLYELFRGRPPFEGADTLLLFQAICEGQRRPVADGAPELPQRLVDAIEACLVVDRASRIPSAAALLEQMDGDEGPPREVWREETLEHVAAKVRAPEPPQAADPSDATWTGSVLEESAGGETLDGFDPAPDRTAPTAPAEPSLGRASGLPAVLALGALLSSLLVGAWVLWPREPEVFSREGIPVLRDDAPIPGLVEQAWAELRANEDIDALRHVDQAIERGATDPAVYFLGVVLARGVGDLDRMGQLLEAGTEQPAGVSPYSSLVEALDAARDGAREVDWMRAPLREHLGAYPDDGAAGVLHALAITWDADATPILESLVAADPDAAVGYVLLSDHHGLHQRNDEALAAADRGLARVPTSAALHGVRASALLRSRRHAEALDAAKRAVELDPRWMPALQTGVRAALFLGDEEGLATVIAPLVNPLVDRRSRAMALTNLGRFYQGVGRLTEARSVWDRAEEALQELDYDTMLAEQAAQRARGALDFGLASDEQLEEDVARLDRVLATVDVPQDRRLRSSYVSRAAHSVLDARRGLEVEPLEPNDRDWLDTLLDGEMAAARGDVDALRAPSDDCRILAWRGRLLVRKGEPAAALPRLEASLMDDICGSSPAMRGLVQGSLAQAHHALGADTEAAEAVAAVRRAWPVLDPSVPLVQALVEDGLLDLTPTR